MEAASIIGFVGFAILCITNLIIVGVYIGTQRTTNEQHGKDIKKLQEDNKIIWERVSDMKSQLHDFDVIHLALKTQADALNLLTTSMTEHMKTPPICGMHLEIEKGATRRDIQIQELQHEILDLKKR